MELTDKMDDVSTVLSTVPDTAEPATVLTTTTTITTTTSYSHAPQETSATTSHTPTSAAASPGSDIPDQSVTQATIPIETDSPGLVSPTSSTTAGDKPKSSLSDKGDNTGNEVLTQERSHFTCKA